MQKFMKVIATLMLMAAVVWTVGCKKDPNNGGNNNGGNNGGGNGGGTTPTEEGMYLGIIGFNEQLYQKEISLLNNSTKTAFINFISNLTPGDGTALYYADYTALQKLQLYSEPPALTKVALVTFTDGLDNLSTSGSIMNPEGYASINAYRTALHNKIINEKIHNKPVTAYTIGLRGQDVQNNLTEFRTNLNMLASNANNVFEVTDMTEALEHFRTIAEDLYHSVTTVNLKLKVPGGIDDGTIIRFTFDDITDGESSSKYIQGTYKRTANNGRRLESISYYGFNTGASSMDPVSQTETGTFHWFEFEGVTHSNGNAITQYDINRLQLWKKQGNIWQRESEFTPGSSSEVTETKTSALIMLVLDCTSSLDNDFSNMQAGAKQFVEALCSSNIGGGTSGSDYSPTVTTSNVSDIDYTSAKCGGTANVNGGSDITAKGVCWSTSPSPTISDPHTNEGGGSGAFTSIITGLGQSTKYYVKAYATNNAGTSYGGQKEFTTDGVLPTITTANVSNITQTTASCGGNVTNDGGNTVTAKGVCWGTNQNPTINNSHTTDGSGTGSFSSNISGLVPSTTYYVRAYATSNAGTNYGEQKTFSTESINYPMVTTNEVANITQTTASCGGNVTADGGGTVTARGVCWSTSQNPTVNDNHTSDGDGMGSFSSSITGLMNGLTYYVRAYATNSAGTSYGSQKTFRTPPDGAIAGLFSVSSTKRVYFSQGNLQYIGSSSTPYWRFADRQWDYFGTTTGQDSGNSNKDRDLFGWGTSGWDNGNTYYRPWNVLAVTGYGPPGSYDLTGSYAHSDWGVHNAISNGGDMAGLWRTLTKSEWNYVLNQRNTDSGSRYAKAQVANTNGVVLLPDHWSSSTYNLTNVNSNNASYSSNIIGEEQWTTLENAGAVFLPAAGNRQGVPLFDVGSQGFYWSASDFTWSAEYAGAHAYFVWFSDTELKLTYDGRDKGQSVRLVCPAN